MAFIASKESVMAHQVPQWYDDCKLGIFIHWGLYSVPSFAPPCAQLGEVELDERWFACNPYAEWYYNSVKIGFGPTYDYHCATYGKDYPYEKFVEDFHCEKYDPRQWIKIFEKAHAGYLVLTTKHHDGYCLWDSQYTDYTSAKTGPKRDLLKELNEAVKESSIKLGVYYSGIIDWRFTHEPMRCEYDVNHPDNISNQYIDYAYNQVMELIDTYHPDVLWNDIGWPFKGREDLPYLLSHYYNACPDGVINDRWNKEYQDFSTKEYKQGSASLTEKWEMTRGLGFSFGYNQQEDESHLISTADLICLLIETVANNGNLLLNVGPRKDGTLCPMQTERLLGLGSWLDEHEEAIFKTHPHTTQHDSTGNAEIYYTAKQDCYYIILTKLQGQDIVIPHVNQQCSCIQAVSKESCQLKKEGTNLLVHLDSIEDIVAYVLKVKK